MATKRTITAARADVRHPAAGARRRRTLADLPERARRELGRRRAGRDAGAGRSLEELAREQLSRTT